MYSAQTRASRACCADEPAPCDAFCVLEHVDTDDGDAERQLAISEQAVRVVGSSGYAAMDLG